MIGWYRIERDAWSHDFFKPSPMSEREAWFWMIGRASYEDTTHRVGGEPLECPRGSFFVTLRELQSVFMWQSDTKVRNFLKRLEKEKMIERTTCGSRNAPKTHVTICNYDKYQSPERTENAPKTHRERTKNAVKKQDNKKQDNSLGEPAGSAPKKGSRLSEDWTLPRAWGEWAVGEGMAEFSVRREADKFRDFWIGAAGAKGVKTNWQATWRNWIRKSIDDAQKQNKQHEKPGFVDSGAFGNIREVC
ncbi:hypothetical protein [Sulfitobacter sp. PM12]|uniref:hypothetical protein n=1 Tax=Sulfitobacter sp. PM12 TaxID=3138497 RepID=UPI00388F54C9